MNLAEAINTQLHSSSASPKLNCSIGQTSSSKATFPSSTTVTINTETVACISSNTVLEEKKHLFAHFLITALVSMSIQSSIVTLSFFHVNGEIKGYL